MDEKLLDIQDLSVWYKTYRGFAEVVDHINLYVGKGEKIGLVGESGCGKTTTMKMVMRTLDERGIKVGEGSKLLFGGEDILAMDAKALLDLRRRKISMISQSPMAALNPVFTIGQQMMDVLKYSGQFDKHDKKGMLDAARKAIDSVMIPDPDRILNSYPHQLSGGMRQRICIATSLLTPRQLLIADEPGTALDVTVQGQIHKLLRRLVEEEKRSLIMITHSLGVVRELVDRIYVMYAGNIVENCDTAELFKNPLHPYTQGLLACVPRLTGGGISAGIYGYIPSYVNPPKGCRFFNRCPHCTERCKQENRAHTWLQKIMRCPASSMRTRDLPRRGETAMSNELLTLKNLKQYFPVGKDRFVRAVDGVDLTINHGDVMGLVGESGSGKSTIAYTVMGMYGMTGGEIDFEGEVFTKETKRKRSMKFRREAQIVFQDPGSSLNPYQDVRSILSLPLKVHKVVPKNEIDDKILEILEMVELPADFMYKSPNSIGGGEKQLVSIARALCCNPKFIILDEPTSSLDVSIQAKIINMLIKLKKEQNLTYMFITHDMGVMRNVSNRVAIMYLGKICEIAPTETFYRNPLHPYTQMLLSSIPVVSEEDETIKPKAVECVGEIPSPVNVPTGCSFHTRCPYKCERCTKEDPVMREVEPGHTVRCHLIDK